MAASALRAHAGPLAALLGGNGSSLLEAATNPPMEIPDSTRVASSALVYGVLVVVSLAAYSVARQRWPQVMAPRLAGPFAATAATTAPLRAQLTRGLRHGASRLTCLLCACRIDLSWSWKALALREADLLRLCGTDGYLLLRVIRFCWALLAAYCLAGLVALFPVYLSTSSDQGAACAAYCARLAEGVGASGGAADADDSPPSGDADEAVAGEWSGLASCVCGAIDRASMAVLEPASGSLWAPALTLTLFSAMTLVGARLEFQAMVRIHTKVWERLPQAHSVLVEHIPAELRDRKGDRIARYFSKIFPGQVVSVDMLDTGSRPFASLVAIGHERNSLVWRLEHVEALLRRQRTRKRRAAAAAATGTTQRVKRWISCAGDSDHGSGGCLSCCSSALPCCNASPPQSRIAELEEQLDFLNSRFQRNRMRYLGKSRRAGGPEQPQQGQHRLSAGAKQPSYDADEDDGDDGDEEADEDGDGEGEEEEEDDDDDADDDADDDGDDDDDDDDDDGDDDVGGGGGGEDDDDNKDGDGADGQANNHRAKSVGANGANGGGEQSSCATGAALPRGAHSAGNGNHHADEAVGHQAILTASVRNAKCGSPARWAGSGDHGFRGRRGSFDRVQPSHVSEDERSDDGGRTGAAQGPSHHHHHLLHRDEDDAKHFSAAFVTFRTLCASALASQSHIDETSQMRVLPAPEPLDVSWEYVGMSSTSRVARRAVTKSLFWLMLLFWGVLTSFVGASTSTEALSRQFPWVRKLLAKHPDLVWYIDQLAPLVLVSLVGVVQPLMGILARFEGRIAESASDKRAMERYLSFLVIQVFLFYSIAGTIFKTFVEILQQPSRIVETLGSTIPKNAAFYVQFIIVKLFWMLCGELLRLADLVLAGLRRLFMGPPLTMRERASMFCGIFSIFYPSAINIPSTLAQVLLVYFIAIVYAVIQPLILVAAFAFFALANVVYTTALTSTSKPMWDSGGRYCWTSAYRAIVWALATAQLTLIGVLLIKRGYSQAVAMWIVFFVTLVFSYKIEGKYAHLVMSMPVHLASELDCQRAGLRRLRVRPDVWQYGAIRPGYRDIDRQDAVVLYSYKHPVLDEPDIAVPHHYNLEPQESPGVAALSERQHDPSAASASETQSLVSESGQAFVSVVSDHPQRQTSSSYGAVRSVRPT